MSGDPMQLVKFVCVAKAHAGGRSDAALTIHDGAWAFCPIGADRTDHEWRPSDGLPLAEAMRFVPREAPPAAQSMPRGSATPAGPPAATPRGKARSR